MRTMLPLLLVLVCMLAAMPAAAWKLDHIITTFWCPPPVTDANLAQLAAEHFTMTWVPESGLDVAQRHGLRAMLHEGGTINPEALDDPEKKAKLDALIDRVKGHPALYAYYLTDEPSAVAFPKWGRLVAYLKEKDPAHLAYINLFPTYANNDQLGTKGDTVTAYREHLRQFIEVVKPELVSYDHYQLFKDRDTDQYFLNLEMIREAALGAGLPFLNIVQAGDGEKVWRFPTPDEERYLNYTTLAYGGRGISYFVYWGWKDYHGIYTDGAASSIQPEIARLNKEVAALSPVLLQLDSLGVWHTEPLPWGTTAVPKSSPVQITGEGEFVLGLFGRGGRPSAFMIANRSHKESQVATLQVKGTQLQEFSRANENWLDYPITKGAVSVRLRPGDGRLFRFAK